MAKKETIMKKIDWALIAILFAAMVFCIVEEEYIIAFCNALWVIVCCLNCKKEEKISLLLELYEFQKESIEYQGQIIKNQEEIIKILENDTREKYRLP